MSGAEPARQQRKPRAARADGTGDDADGGGGGGDAWGLVNPWCVAAAYADLAGHAQAALVLWTLNRAFRASFRVTGSTDMDLQISQLRTAPGSLAVYQVFFDEACRAIGNAATAVGADDDAPLRPVPFYVLPPEAPEPVAVAGADATRAPVQPVCDDAVFAFPRATHNHTDLTLCGSHPRLCLAVRVRSTPSPLPQPPQQQQALGQQQTPEPQQQQHQQQWVFLSAEEIVEAVRRVRRGGNTVDPAHESERRARELRSAAAAAAMAAAVEKKGAPMSEADLIRRAHVVTLATCAALVGKPRNYGAGAQVFAEYAYDEVAMRAVRGMDGGGAAATAYTDRFVWFNVQRAPVWPPAQALPRARGSGSGSGSGSSSDGASNDTTAGRQEMVPVPLWAFVDTRATCADVAPDGTLRCVRTCASDGGALLLHVLRAGEV